MNYRLKKLSDQVIVITGASSGIGLVTARAAAAQGARVLLVSRDGPALEQAVRDIVSRGGAADHAVADVGVPEEVAAAADRAIQRWGHIDTWVNNAGVGIVARLLDTPLPEHERIFRTNYFGVVNGSAVAVRHLRERGGALITVASIASDLPTPMQGAYAATKHATRAFVETLRMELRADSVPISVTIIKPSGIDTPFARHAQSHAPGQGEIPPPVYDPELVAGAILDAAVHPRRDVTVGGAGRLQVLLGTHFPALLERVSRLVMDQSFDPARPRPARSALFAPAGDLEERSGEHRPRRTSLYTAARTHPALTVLGLASVAGLVGVAVARRNRRLL